jgi:hypothetical protein
MLACRMLSPQGLLKILVMAATMVIERIEIAA